MCARFFVPPPYEKLEDYNVAADRELEFQTWYRYDPASKGARISHRVRVPEEARRRAGDMTSEQRETLADLADA